MAGAGDLNVAGVRRPSVAGSNGQLLFNFSGVEGASANLSFNVASNTLSTVNANISNTLIVGSGNANGEIILYAVTVTDQTLPAANTLGLYSKNVANLMFVYVNSGIANNSNFNPINPIHGHLGFRDVYRWMPAGLPVATSNATSVFSDGLSMNVVSNSATILYPTNASPILKNSSVRLQLNANSTLLGNANAWVFSNQNVCWSGLGAGSGNGGGFLLINVFSIDSAVGSPTTNSSFFCGMSNIKSQLTASNLDPLVNTTQSMFGVGCNATSTDLFVTFGPAGIASRNIVDMGANFALGTTDVYELTLYVPPGGLSMGMRCRNLTNGAEFSFLSTAAANIAPANTFLQPTMYIISNTHASQGAVTGNGQISLVRGYLELFS